MGEHRKLPRPPLAPPPPQYLEALMAAKDVPTGRRALVLPVLPGLKPGLDVYEQVIFPIRRPEIDIYGLTIPFGPIPEDSLYVYGELLDFVIQDRSVVEDEGAIRTRAWLDEMTPLYDRIVLFSYMPSVTLKPWSRAIAWSGAGNKTRIVKMTKQQRITDPFVQNLIRSALGLPRPEVARSAPWDAGSAFEDVFDQPFTKNDDDLLDDDDGDLLGDDDDLLEEEEGDVVEEKPKGDMLESLGRAVPGTKMRGLPMPPRLPR